VCSSDLQVLDRTFFPELFDVRTEIGS
jgi:hypothetical protein